MLPEAGAIIGGRESTAIIAKVQSFEGAVAGMFERWVTRRESPHTQRAYRRDVLTFAEFVNIPVQPGPPPTLDELSARELLRFSIADVQAWRDQMVHELGRAPKNMLGRVSSLSRFYEYMREHAAEFRLPIIVPTPAHKTHIPRDEAEAVEPTKELTPSRIRQLKKLITREVV